MKFENKLREWATPVTIGSFFLTAVTGILLFFKQEVGLVKHVHEWFSWLLVIGTILHVMVNWRASVRYFSKPSGRGILIFFLLLTCASFIPINIEEHHGGNPLQKISDTLIQTSLQDVAPVASHSLQEATDILNAQGISVGNQKQTIREIAEKNKTSPMRVLDVIF